MDDLKEWNKGVDLLPCPFCGSKSVHLAENTLEGYFIGYSVHCNGCGVENRYTKDMKKAVNAWNTRTSGWIPCSEKMPEDNVNVLGNITITVNANIAKPKQRTIFAKHDRAFGWTTANGYPIVGKITHWMPIPEPPKGDAKDEHRGKP